MQRRTAAQGVGQAISMKQFFKRLDSEEKAAGHAPPPAAGRGGAPKPFPSPPMPRKPRAPYRGGATAGPPLSGEYDRDTPIRVVLAGASGTGKTHTLTELIMENRVPSDRVYWFAPSASITGINSARLDRVQARIGEDRFLMIPADPVVGITPAQGEQLMAELKQAQDLGLRTLVVCDDLSITASKQPALTQLYVNGRHLGASVAELTQKLFSVGDKTSAVRRLNCTQFLLFWLSGYKQTNDLATSFHVHGGDDAARLRLAYKHAMTRKGRNKGSYLLVDTVAGRHPDESKRMYEYRDSGLDNYVLVSESDLAEDAAPRRRRK